MCLHFKLSIESVSPLTQTPSTKRGRAASFYPRSSDFLTSAVRCLGFLRCAFLCRSLLQMVDELTEECQSPNTHQALFLLWHSGECIDYMHHSVGLVTALLPTASPCSISLTLLGRSPVHHFPHLWPFKTLNFLARPLTLWGTPPTPHQGEGICPSQPVPPDPQLTASCTRLLNHLPRWCDCTQTHTHCTQVWHMRLTKFNLTLSALMGIYPTNFILCPFFIHFHLSVSILSLFSYTCFICYVFYMGVSEN